MSGAVTRYVLQFPGSPAPTVLVIDDLYRDDFLDLFSEVIIHSGAVTREIPDACLIACTPEPGDTCAICLEEASDSDHGWVSLSGCTHRFHRHCVTQVCGTTCPLCRTLQSAEAV